MLHLLANSLRYGGPVGGLFVVVLGALFLFVLLVPSLVRTLLGWQFFPGALAVFFLTVLFQSLVRNRRTPVPSSDPISRWPKLGQNDHRHVRSKLQKPCRIK